MLTRANKVVETRDVTWEATLSIGTPSPPLPEMPEQGGTVDLEEAPEPGGTDVYESAPTTPLPVLGRGIPHQLRAVSPMTQAGGDSQAEREELNDSSTVSNEPPESDTSSRDDDDASSFDHRAPTPTAIRTAARQLGAHMSGPGDGEEIREGSTRAQTRALNREAATGLIGMIGPSYSMRYWRRKTQAVNLLGCRIASSRRRNRNRRLTPRRVLQSTLAFV